MSAWLAMKQALTAMDLVTRGWARDLDLDECGVMVLMLLGERGHDPACNLAYRSGRARQQVQRSLGMMRRRGLVTPLVVSARGRVQAWKLTERGLTMWGLLEQAMQAWDEDLERRVNVAELTAELQRVVSVIVNRPGGDGWRRGLLVPYELRRASIRTRASMEEGLLDQTPPAAETSLPLEAGHHESISGNPNWTDAERESVARAWRALWR